jgi:hypothetical protein
MLRRNPILAASGKIPGMSDNDPSLSYRLVGTREDGTRATVLGAMTLREAQRAREAIEMAGIFAHVEISAEADGGP